MKIALGPEAGQFEELMRGPADTPVVMLNLLKFKARAETPGEEVSGQEAYGRYAAEMRKVVEAAGGRFIWAGRIDSQVIGQSDVDFDVAALVEYPSREAFVKIVTSAKVAEIGVSRSQGLEGQWLLATTGASI